MANDVLVLLATYNGARYLDEQLASVETQTVDEISVLVSDDGSSDDTLNRLSDWEQRWAKGTFAVVPGPREGFAENFRYLIAKGDANASFVTFCDQDDVWDRDKLARAIATLEQSDANKPALYGSRSRLIDEDGATFGLSPLFPYPPAFRNAIVQSYAGGNTMVMNRPAFGVLQESARRTSFHMHDWWTYLIVSGAGGDVYYDREPHIGYRQHLGNAVGGPITILQRPRRTMDLLRGKFVESSDLNVASLGKCLDLLTDDAKEVIRQFEELRKGSPIAVPSRLVRSGLYRQTIKGNIAMVVAALLHKL